MKLFSTPVVLLFLALLILLHFVSLVARGKMAKILNFVNIFLHIALFIPLLDNKFSIEEAVLVYMISLFAYTLFAVLLYRRAVKRSERLEKIRERFSKRKEDSAAREGEV